MTDSISKQGTTISRYRSKRQKNRVITHDGGTAVSQLTPATKATSAIDVAISDPMRAATNVEPVAVPSSDDNTETILAPSGTLRLAILDVEHRGSVSDGTAQNSINTATLPLEQDVHVGAVWSRPVYPITQSPSSPQSVAPRAHDGPPKSSDINATTVLKAHRVATTDNERRVGCLSFIRRGTRHRTELGSVTEAAKRNATKRSTEQLCHACSRETQVPEKAGLVKDASFEDFRSSDAQAYRNVRRGRSSPSSEPAKQASGSYIAVETPPRDWRPVEHSDSATIPSPRCFETLSPQPPYDMRHGAVQPQYFYTDTGTSADRQLASNKPLRQRSVQRSISGTTTGSSLPDTRSGTTLSASSSARSKPLIDLTPQYQPPPQHKHKGHGYYPERLGSGKLVDYATSPKKESNISFGLN